MSLPHDLIDFTSTYHSFRSTILTPVSTAVIKDTDEDPSSSNELTVEFVKQYLKGIEKNSILIDITDIKDAHMLRKALQVFNKDADEENGCDDYCDRLPSTRRYLNRSFIETSWTKDSPGYKAILNTDIRLEDGTFVRGFLSLPDNAKIVRFKLDRLPLKAPQRMRKDMENCLFEYSRVSDLGINRSHDCFTGQGYAALNLTPADANDLPFEPL
ncbi:hypothetical protein CU098_012652 [Rhizopus stolonifer]|uniref:Uncharacterized protein n=1 Tax=Rhizopus stolonifer TaxID=4846 RepID=A0A367KVM0_RHIST|nr:hypothetical protein CU098_012652 [Rhizopus stolonifer]